MHDIVLFENDPTLVDVLCLILEDDGHVVTTYPSSSALRLHLRKRAFPAIVLFDYRDQGQPSDDSILQSVVNDPFLQRAHHYILMTTNPLPEGTLSVVQRLHIDVLYKPFELEDFLTFIRDTSQDHAPVVA